MTSTRCALYLRVSLDKTGEQLAVDRQREDALEIVHKRGWEVVEEYVDNSISASSKDIKRPAYDRMVKDFQGGAFDALICYDLDRLTRQPRQLEDWIDAAQDRGLQLVTANGEADLSTDNGRLFARIKASVARAEIERKSARQKRAFKQQASMGIPHASTRPFGYRADLLTLHPVETPLLRKAAADVLTGKPLSAVCREWAAAGIVSSHKRVAAEGRPYSREGIRQMLVNPRYAGRRIYLGDDVGEGAWAPVLDLETHLALQRMLGDPKRKRRPSSSGSKAENLLTSIAMCGHCGGKVKATTRKQRKLKEGAPRPNIPNYTCSAGRCFEIDRSVADSEVTTRVVGRLGHPDYLLGLIESTGGSPEVTLREIEALQKRQEALGESFALGTISQGVMEAGVAKIEERLIELSEQMKRSVSVPAFDDLDIGTDAVVEQFERKLNITQKREVVRATCERIELWPIRESGPRVVVELV